MPLSSIKYSVYKKNNKYLYIFSEIPYWIVVSTYGKIILEQFLNNKSTIEVRKNIKELCGLNWEIYNKHFDKLINDLYDNMSRTGIFDNKFSNERIQTFTQKIDSIGINITKNCNLHCRYCYADAKDLNNKSSNNINYISKFLSESREFASDNCYVQLTGGEPFLENKVLFGTLDILKTLKYSNVTINTNGLLITNDIIKELIKYKNIKNITISLDGEENIHDVFRGSGSYKKSIEAIRMLKDYFIVTASMTVHDKNLKFIDSFIEFCKTNGIVAFTNPMFPIGRCKKNEDIVTVNINDLFLKLKEIYKTGKYSVTDIEGTFLSTIMLPLRDLKKKHYCGMGLSSTFLDVDGNIYPCANTVGIDEFLCGNIINNSFKDIWVNSNKYNFLRTEIDVDKNQDCKSCELKYICAGFCRGMNYQSTGQLNSKSIWCSDLKKAIIDAMWTINDFPELFKEKKDNFA